MRIYLLGARVALQRQRLCMGCQHGAQVAQRHNPHPFRALIQMGQGSAFGIKATAFVDTGSNLPIRPAYPRRSSDELRVGKEGASPCRYRWTPSLIKNKNTRPRL